MHDPITSITSRGCSIISSDRFLDLFLFLPASMDTYLHDAHSRTRENTNNLDDNSHSRHDTRIREGNTRDTLNSRRTRLLSRRRLLTRSINRSPLSKT